MTSDALFTVQPRRDVEERKRATRLAKMHLLYGRLDGHACGDCQHLLRVDYARTYYKCRPDTDWLARHIAWRAHYKCQLYRSSGGPATDWRVRNVACGKFESQT